MIDEFDELFFNADQPKNVGSAFNILNTLVYIVSSLPACLVSGTAFCDHLLTSAYEKLGVKKVEISIMTDLITKMQEAKLSYKQNLIEIIEEKAKYNPVLV